MSPASRHPALERILSNEESAAAFCRLSEMAGTDLTTFLLGLFAGRADEVSATDVMRQYTADRFVSPTPVDALAVARIELAALEAASTAFDIVGLAPLAPFAAHRSLGATPQNNVVTTGRLSEVAADPTSTLALEAAVRRAQLMSDDARSSTVVQLAAVQRVVRAQHFEGPRSFAHFSLLGLVSAGRDVGSSQFEADALVEHLRVLSSIVRSATEGAITVRLTPFAERFGPVCEAVGSAIASDTVSSEIWPEREHGRGYYQNICFKLYVDIDGEECELGDGGDVPWTQRLLQSRKERLLISGIGLERLAMLTT